MIAPNASAVTSQMRKRATATESNRARDAINSERFRDSTLTAVISEKSYNSPETRAASIDDFLVTLVVFGTLQVVVAGAGARGATLRIFSRSRRMMAFNLPPNNNSRQVRYIHVSSTMMDASAR